jgi:hypothetical protein
MVHGLLKNFVLMKCMSKKPGLIFEQAGASESMYKDQDATGIYKNRGFADLPRLCYLVDRNGQHGTELYIYVYRCFYSLK